MRGGLVVLIGGLAIASIASAAPLTSVWTGGRPLLLAGAPPDSPANRVDPNVATSPYAGVVSINMRYTDPDGTPHGSLCTGSAISPTWILTAAHCVDPFDTGVVIDLAKPGNDVRIALNDMDPFDRPDDIYVANFVAIHPDFPGFANCPFGNPGCLNDDLALIRLERPLPPTVPVYSFFEQPAAVGTVFHMVGYGDGGNGIDGYTPDAESDFFVKRIGANVFDVFDRDDEQGFAPTSPAEIFGFDFDGTKNGQERDQFCEQAIHVCSAKLPNDVETLLGPGDSGGPSFIKTVAGELLLAGVNTFHYTFAYRLPNGELDDTPGDFGDSGGGVLLYSYLDWIRATAVPEPDSLALFVLAAGLLAAFRRRGVRARHAASVSVRIGVLSLGVGLYLGCGTYSGALAAPAYVCVGSCSPIIVTDPTLPPPSLGNLVNVLDVPVDGVLYDVAFVDGTFNGIFGSTTPALQFTTLDQAQKAAQALSDTLVDVGDQHFDSNPSLARGCSNDQACVIMTPFSLAPEVASGLFRWVGFVNDNPFLGMVTGDSILGADGGILDSRSNDFASGGAFDDRTFAVWRLAASTSPPGDDPLNRFFTPPAYGATASVDEPGVLALLGIPFALLALNACRRARNRRSPHAGRASKPQQQRSSVAARLRRAFPRGRSPAVGSVQPPAFGAAESNNPAAYAANARPSRAGVGSSHRRATH